MYGGSPCNILWGGGGGGVTSAWGLTLGDGADDQVTSIPSYANVAAFLANADRYADRNAEINGRLYPTFFLSDFEGAGNTLTDANLVATYTDRAAFNAATGRTDTVFAVVDGELYESENLDVLGVNAEPESLEFRTTAVGDGARANGYDATAVGQGARATGDETVAVGQTSSAQGGRSIAIGDHARAYGIRSTTIGHFAHGGGDRSTAVGQNSATYGDRSSAFGRYANALGERSTALGQGAYAANLESGQEFEDVIPTTDGEGFPGELIECALDQRADPQDCRKYYTAEERANPLLTAETAEGEAFRAGIQTRLQGVLDGLTVERATAVGDSARAINDDTTAVGQGAKASGEQTTALGQRARATGDDATALGQRARATGEDATAVGQGARATNRQSTALGQLSGAQGENSIALGDHTRAYGDRSTALGQFAHSGGERSTAVGQISSTYGDRSSAFGRYANALGLRSTALGHGAYAANLAPGEDFEDVIAADDNMGTPDELIECALDAEVYIPDCLKFYTAEEQANPLLMAETPEGEAFRAGIQTRLQGVLDGLTVERATAVGADAHAINSFTTAIGVSTEASGEGSTAVGAGAEAAGRLSTALGAGAVAVRDNQIVLGIGSVQDDPATAVDETRAASTYTLPGLPDDSASGLQSGPTELVTTDADGNLATDGGSVRGEIAAETAARTTGDNALRTDLGTATDTAAADGSAYARIRAVQSGLGTETTARTDGDAALRTDLGTATDTAAADGSAYARIRSVQSGLETETIAREAAVSRIDGTLSSLSSAIAGGGGELVTERAARIAGDNALRTDLGTATDAAAADGSAYARIRSVQSGLGTETTARTDGDAALRTDLGTATDAAAADGSAYARISAVQSGLETETTARTDGDAALRTDLGTAADVEAADGSAYARIRAVQSGLGTDADTADADGSAYARIGAVQSGLGTVADMADADGSAYARISAVQSVLGTADDTADEDGSAYARISAVQSVLRLAAEIDSAGAAVVVEAAVEEVVEEFEEQVGTVVDAVNEVNELTDTVTLMRVEEPTAQAVVLRGGTINQKVAYLATQIGTAVDLDAPIVILDDDGVPIQLNTDERNFINLGVQQGAAQQNQLLFRHLYGDPGGPTIADGERGANSEMPEPGSIAGRIEQMEDGLGFELEETTDEPAAGVTRRVVVEETVGGRTQLRTLNLGALGGLDQRVDGLNRRVESLSTQLDEGIAMSAALSALPNAVPGKGRYTLGLGLGNHGGSSAVAMGFAGRLKKSTHINIGISTAGDTITSRAGVSWSW